MLVTTIPPPLMKFAEREKKKILSAETVQRTSLSFQGIDDIERGDGLAFGVFGVGDGVTDDGFEEGFQHPAGFFVDHWGVGGLARRSFFRGGGGGRQFFVGNWGLGEQGGEERRGHTGGDTLDASSAGEAADGGFGDALDVVAEDLAVALGAAFAEAFATFSACGGGEWG